MEKKTKVRGKGSFPGIDAFTVKANEKQGWSFAPLVPLRQLAHHGSSGVGWAERQWVGGGLRPPRYGTIL